MSIRNWVEDKITSLRVGGPVHIANGGNAVDEVVIRYKEFYFSIFIDVEGGEPTGDFGWSRDFGMFHVPIRDHYKAVRVRSESTTVGTNDLPRATTGALTGVKNKP